MTKTEIPMTFDEAVALMLMAQDQPFMEHCAGVKGGSIQAMQTLRPMLVDARKVVGMAAIEYFGRRNYETLERRTYGVTDAKGEHAERLTKTLRRSMELAPPKPKKGNTP